MDSGFALRAPRNDERRHDFAFSRHDLPEVLQIVSPSSNSEGAGNAGCALHPRSHGQVCTTSAPTSIQGSGEHPTSPARWLYGLWRELPGRAVLVVTVAPWRLSSRRNLTPAYRASGPHAFTVRLCRA